MSKIAPDGTRGAYGLNALRKRYVRRAEFLSRDAEYLEAIRTARAQWNRDYPRFPIVPDEVDYGPPVSLRADHYATAIRISVQTWPSEAEFRAMPEVFGWWDWGKRAFELADRFWPILDFPNPYQPETHDRDFPEFLMQGDDPTKGDIQWSGYIHPARRFVEKSLLSDPRLIDAGGYIRVPSLYVDNMRDARDELPDAEFDPATYRPVYCIPIYPGITANDIREAAGELAREAEEVYGTRTASARVHALRAEGLTHQQIADRLGLTRQNAARILAATGGGAHGK